MKITDIALTLDHYAAYVPGVSTIQAIVNIATKIILSFSQISPQNHYFHHIQSKSNLDCFLLLVPFGYVIYHAYKPAAPPAVAPTPPTVAPNRSATVRDWVQLGLEQEKLGNWLTALGYYINAIKQGRGSEQLGQSDVATHFQTLVLIHKDDAPPPPDNRDFHLGKHFYDLDQRFYFLQAAAHVIGNRSEECIALYFERHKEPRDADYSLISSIGRDLGILRRDGHYGHYITH